MAFESPSLGARVLIIQCKVRKWDKIPSTFEAQNPLFGMYIGVISLGAITLPMCSFLGMARWAGNPRILANWDSLIENFLPLVIHMKILSLVPKKRVA
jgi:hypothetical protein